MTAGPDRVAVYGVAIRPDADGDRVLLCRIAAGDDAAGRWTLPGGGMDHGEHPEAMLRREFAEETGLIPEVVRLLGFDSIVIPAERTVDGHAHHGLRIVYQVRCDGEPEVAEIDGSVDLAAWWDLGALPPVVSLVHGALDLVGIET